ncbi:MAG TPA: ABC transporter permease [Candidatus Acidoferrales bacterium]|nr:ABC transporter permease [Candidatus Acidoferrales bacterium]
MNLRRRSLHDLDSDIRDHIARETRDNLARGMSPEDARLSALRKFGNLTLAKEDTRGVWIATWLEQLSQDIRFALRTLRKSPGFTSVAVLTLALGIGANSAIFSVVNAVLFHPLTYKNPSTIVWITDYLPRNPEPAVFDAEYFNFARRAHSLEDIAAYSPFGNLTLIGAGDPLRVPVGRVTRTFFDVLGINMALGRPFNAEEDRPNGTRAAILSDSLWRSRFGSDPNVIGKPIALDGAREGNSFTIVGVLPRGFEFLDTARTDLILPFELNDRPIQPGRTIWFVLLIGRLRPGVSIAAVASELDAANTALHASVSGGYAKMMAGSRIEVMTLHDHLVGSSVRPLLLIFGSVVFVLLIACANVASLQLARAVSRRREIAVRGVLGAGRWRVIRQLLTESALLGVIGGTAGIALAVWFASLARRFGPHTFPHLANAHVEWRVALFTLVISISAGILFGCAPIFATFRSAPAASLKSGAARAGADKFSRWLQQALTVGELAIALILFVGAGLLTRSFVKLNSVPLGFDPHNALTAEISMPMREYPDTPQQHAFAAELLDRVRAIPGVTDVGSGSVLPTQGVAMMSAVNIQGQPEVDPTDPSRAASANASVFLTTPGYFSALRIPLLQGRYLDSRDAPGAPLSVNVNEAFATHFFPDGNALGQSLSFAGQKWWTIVGIVGNTREGIATPPSPGIFTTDQQGFELHHSLVIRAQGDPLQLVPALRSVLAQMDKDIPLYGVETLEEMLARNVAPERFNAFLLGVFASLALVLAAVGTYGVIAYIVGQRTSEIGIRMALGAMRGHVLRMILFQGAWMAIAGVAFGLAASFGLTRLMRSFLFDITANDSLSFTFAALALLLVALFACAIPARRATRVDPLVALRHE